MTRSDLIARVRGLVPREVSDEDVVFFLTRMSREHRVFRETESWAEFVVREAAKELRAVTGC